MAGEERDGRGVVEGEGLARLKSREGRCRAGGWGAIERKERLSPSLELPLGHGLRGVPAPERGTEERLGGGDGERGDGAVLEDVRRHPMDRHREQGREERDGAGEQARDGERVGAQADPVRLRSVSECL